MCCGGEREEGAAWCDHRDSLQLLRSESSHFRLTSTFKALHAISRKHVLLFISHPPSQARLAKTRSDGSLGVRVGNPKSGRTAPRQWVRASTLQWKNAINSRLCMHSNLALPSAHPEVLVLCFLTIVPPTSHSDWHCPSPSLPPSSPDETFPHPSNLHLHLLGFSSLNPNLHILMGSIQQH
ncbi:hypothetical protein V2G26_018152 [Clonostachys chloroleuca]